LCWSYFLPSLKEFFAKRWLGQIFIFTFPYKLLVLVLYLPFILGIFHFYLKSFSRLRCTTINWSYIHRCGAGNISKSYEDLGSGSYFEVDKCCRTHDHCPVTVGAFSMMFNTFNYHPYTKSHCACDDIVYDCLKHVVANKQKFGAHAARQASKLGFLYFNLAGTECLKPKHKRKCVSYSQLTKHYSRQARFFTDHSRHYEKTEPVLKCNKWILEESENFTFQKPRRSFWISWYMKYEE